MQRVGVVLLAFSSLAGTAGAQEPTLIGPGHRTLRADCTPTTDTIVTVATTPGSRDSTTGTMVRTRVSASQSQGLCVVVRQSLGGATRLLDSTVVTTPTLTPVRYSASVGGDRFDLRLLADSVVGSLRRGDSTPRAVALVAPGPYFVASFDQELIGALPLALGYAAQFLSYQPRGVVTRSTLRVEGIDTVAVGGRAEPSWRVGLQSGSSRTIVWVRQADGRLLRSRTDLGAGRAVWRLAASDRPPAWGGPSRFPEWLAGCWEMRRGSRVVEERWMSPRGGLMMGSSRTVQGESAVEWESLRIDLSPDGLVYHALPSGQAAAFFTAEVSSDTLIRFANPNHDFPQRITYLARGRDSVVARVEGTLGQRTRSLEFPYARVSCDGR